MFRNKKMEVENKVSETLGVEVVIKAGAIRESDMLTAALREQG